MREPPWQSPKSCVYRAGLLLSSKYTVLPSGFVYSTSCVAELAAADDELVAAETRPQNERCEARETKTKNHEGSRKATIFPFVHLWDPWRDKSDRVESIEEYTKCQAVAGCDFGCALLTFPTSRVSQEPRYTRTNISGEYGGL